MVKRLGEILLERGAIAIAELHTGLEACHYNGGRLGTQLLKFGFVDEHALLEALSEQLDVPSVSSAVLRRVPDRLKRLIPTHVARRIQAMVFEKRGENLGVAMTTPRNPAAIEEVISYLGLDIKPHVATETAILEALTEIQEYPTETADPNRRHGRRVRSAGTTDAWDRLWKPPRLRSSDLLNVKQKKDNGNNPLASTFPGLSPIPKSNRAAATRPLDSKAYRQLLCQADNRDEVGELLLRRASAILDRCFLLVVHTGKIVGWLAKGAGVVVDDVQSFSIPTETKSVLSEAGDENGFWGRIPPGETNGLLTSTLGDPPPTEIAIIPVLVKNRVVAYLVGDASNSRTPNLHREALVDAAQKASIAFEVLILKKKIVS